MILTRNQLTPSVGMIKHTKALLFNLCLPGQNEMWVKFYHFGTKNDDEKWSRKNIFEITPCPKPFPENLLYFVVDFLHKTTKFSNKNEFLCACRDFQKNLCGGCKAK